MCVTGSSLMVILDLDKRISVIASAVFAAAYTVVGGFYSVSYTDVLQQLLITIGLVSVIRYEDYKNSSYEF
jgi:high affinity choline transporter 7